MIKTSKSKKKGFTLVEMVLSLAIICMIGGVIAGLCASISNSFVSTYNIDDAADYALLYARGFENHFLVYTQDSKYNTKKWSWKIEYKASSDGTQIPTLCYYDKDGTYVGNVFNPRFMETSGPKNKWSVCMFFYYDTAKEIVEYRIFIGDNYSKTHYCYLYTGSFWVPRFEERASFAGAARTISTSDLSLSKTTLKTYGFSDEQLNQIPNDVWTDSRNGDFKTCITYSG